jgi:hypothetical protein
MVPVLPFHRVMTTYKHIAAIVAGTLAASALALKFGTMLRPYQDRGLGLYALGLPVAYVAVRCTLLVLWSPQFPRNVWHRLVELTPVLVAPLLAMFLMSEELKTEAVLEHHSRQFAVQGRYFEDVRAQLVSAYKIEHQRQRCSGLEQGMSSQCSKTWNRMDHYSRATVPEWTRETWRASNDVDAIFNLNVEMQLEAWSIGCPIQPTPARAREVVVPTTYLSLVLFAVTRPAYALLWAGLILLMLAPEVLASSLERL